MTTLRKAIHRLTVEPFVNFGPDRGRPFVVTLAPGDVITFKPKGRREGAQVTARLADVWRLILIARSNAERMERLRQIKAKKAIARETRRLKAAVKKGSQ